MGTGEESDSARAKTASPRADIRAAVSSGDIETARALFREYADQLGVDLCFQGFEAELRDLPGGYAAPRGVLLLAFEEDGRPAGCVGVRAVEGEVCEIKRLYVRDDQRGTGLGRALAERAIAAARDCGYRAMRLDTLQDMTAARALYASLGFRPIEPYFHSPIPTAFMELRLDEA